MLLIDLRDIAAVQQNLSAGGVVKARDQIDQRALAAAGRADDADGFAGMDLQRDVLQDILAGRIGEKDMVKADVTGDVRRQGMGRLRLRGLLGQHLADALGRGHGADGGVDDIGDHGDSEQHLGHVVDGGHQPADLRGLLASRDPQQQHDAEVDGQVDQRREDRHDAQGAGVGRCQIRGGIVKAPGLFLFGAEGLDDTHRGKKLAGDAVEPVQLILDGAELRVADADVAVDQQGDDGDDGDDDRRLPRGLQNDQHDGADAGDRSLDHHAHQAVDEVLDLGHVIGDAGDDGGRLQAVDVGQRQLLDIVVHVPPQFPADGLRGAAGEEVAQDRGDGADGGDCQHDPSVVQNDGHIRLLNALIHDAGHEGWLQKIRDRLQGQKEGGQQKDAEVAAQILCDQLHPLSRLPFSGSS